MPHENAVTASRDSSRTVAAGLLAWVWPGLGHLYLRRTGKGLILMGAILALFVLGVAMDSRLQLHLGLEDPLALLFSAAQMGIGAPYFLARAVGFEVHAWRPETSAVESFDLNPRECLFVARRPRPQALARRAA